MKHITGAALTLLILLLSCIFLMKQVEKTTVATYDMIEQACKTDDRETMRALLDQADQYWTSHEGILGTVLRHDEIDKVGDSIAKLISYATNNDWDEFRGTCAELLATLSHIREKEYPILHNIM